MPMGERAGYRAAVALYMLGLAWLSLSRGGDPTCEGAWLSESTSLSRADLLVNLVAYVPLGVLLAARGAVATASIARRLVLAVAVGGLLSLFVETVQSCLPARVSAWSDLLANVGGTVIGITLPGFAAYVYRWFDAGRVPGLPAGAIAPQPLRALSLLTLGTWVAGRTFPWAVGMDIGQLRANLAFLRPLLLDGHLTLDSWRMASHVTAWLVFGLAIRAGLKPWAPVLRTTAVAASAVLLLQLILAVPTLSVEQLVGLAIAAALLFAFRLPVLERGLPGALGVAAVAGVTLYELRPGVGPAADGFSWLPVFGGGNPLGALELGLYFFGFAFACALATTWRSTLLRTRQPSRAGSAGQRSLRPPAPGASAPAVGRANLRGTVLSVVASSGWLCVLEVAQVWIPGRSPDISPPLLVAIGWAIALGVRGRVTSPVPPKANRSVPSPADPS